MSRKPVISINADTFCDQHGVVTGVRSSYWEAVVDAGGIPVVLPDMESRDDIREFLDRVDGMILTGGDDLRSERLGQPIHPRAYPVTGNRDRADFFLIEIVLETRMPVLGICLGFQELNIYCGGTIWQDLEDECPQAMQHRGNGKLKFVHHDIQVSPGSELSRIWQGRPEMEVNSAHHQAVRDLCRGLNPVAVSVDGIVEAVEMEGHPHLLGVQWHPERMMENSDQAKLFRSLVENACVRM